MIASALRGPKVTSLKKAADQRGVETLFDPV
jgi:hypothetical protein